MYMIIYRCSYSCTHGCVQKLYRDAVSYSKSIVTEDPIHRIGYNKQPPKQHTPRKPQSTIVKLNGIKQDSTIL